MNIIAILWVGLLIIIFIGTYIMNIKTPKPEGCDDHIECGQCRDFSCSHNIVHHKEEMK